MGPVTRPDTTRTAARAPSELDGHATRPRLSYRATALVRNPWWRSSTALVWIALLIVYVVWGSTYLAIRVTVETMPPLISAGTRFLTAAVLLAVALVVVRRRLSTLRITRREFFGAGTIGILLLTCGNGGVVIGEQTVPSALAALLVASVPLWVVVLRFTSGDRPGWATLFGVLVGFVGLAVLALPGGSAGATSAAITIGTVVILGASLCWASGSFLSARLPLPVDPFVTAVWQMAIGGTALWVLGVARGELAGTDVLQDPFGFLADISTRSWTALAWLIVAGSVIAFTAYAWLLQNASISLVSTYAYVNPIVAVVLGGLILDEAVTTAILVGGAIVVLAVVVVVSTERPREPDPEPALSDPLSTGPLSTKPLSTK
jgi:drug/metabolite transporter (DMT)-like permease